MPDLRLMWQALHVNFGQMDPGNDPGDRLGSFLFRIAPDCLGPAVTSKTPIGSGSGRGPIVPPRRHAPEDVEGASAVPSETLPRDPGGTVLRIRWTVPGNSVDDPKSA